MVINQKVLQNAKKAVLIHPPPPSCQVYSPLRTSAARVTSPWRVNVLLLPQWGSGSCIRQFSLHFFTLQGEGEGVVNYLKIIGVGKEIPKAFLHGK